MNLLFVANNVMLLHLTFKFDQEGKLDMKLDVMDSGSSDCDRLQENGFIDEGSQALTL